MYDYYDYYGYGGGIGAFGWFILITCVAISIFAALQFGKIAEMKGHSKNTYFWYALLFGPAGWIIVAALPDRGIQAPKTSAQPTTEEHSSDQLPTL